MSDSDHNQKNDRYSRRDFPKRSAVSELSEISVARRGQPMSFPDFTRGTWKTNPRIFCAEL